MYDHDHGVYDHCVATHVRKNITLPRSLDERIRKTARKRGTTQSGLIVHLVEKGLAAEASQVDACWPSLESSTDLQTCPKPSMRRCITAELSRGQRASDCCPESW